MANASRTSFSSGDNTGHPVLSNDGAIHIIRTEWAPSLSGSTVSSNDYIVNNYKSLTIVAPTITDDENDLAGGFSYFYVMRGKVYSKLSSYNGPAYYIVDNNLHVFQWCMYPKLTYNTTSDRFALLFYANLLPSGNIYQIANSPLYGTQTSSTEYKEEVRDDVEKPSTESGATSYKTTCPIKGLDENGDIELKTANSDTEGSVTVALLYSLGQFVAFTETNGTVNVLPIFTVPVIIDTIDTEKAMVDFYYSPRPTNAGGGGGGGETTSQQCRIPYYVA